MRALSIRQPWAYAITRLGKDVENRTWTARYRGLLAIHAGGKLDTHGDLGEAAFRRVAELGEQPVPLVQQGAAIRSAVIAVAQLTDICSESLRWGTRQCRCGRWAMPAQRHFRLANVRPLAKPVPVPGALGLWRLPPEIEAAVRAQVGLVAQR